MECGISDLFRVVKRPPRLEHIDLWVEQQNYFSPALLQTAEKLIMLVVQNVQPFNTFESLFTIYFFVSIFFYPRFIFSFH